MTTISSVGDVHSFSSCCRSGADADAALLLLLLRPPLTLLGVQSDRIGRDDVLSAHQICVMNIHAVRLIYSHSSIMELRFKACGDC